MRASRNELTALLQQVFEALGYTQSNYEVAAQQLVWAVMHGFATLDSLPILNLSPVSAEEQHLHFDLNDAANTLDSVRLDARNLLSLFSLPTAANLLQARTEDNHAAHIQVLNCRQPALAIKTITELGQRGLYATMAWTSNIGAQNGVQIAAGDALPRVWISDLDNSITEGLTLDLWCSRSGHGLSNIPDYPDIPDLPASDCAESDPAKFIECHRQMLERGIPIDESLWRQFAGIAAGVLVEATEQSRRGAGA